ncbi:MAG: glycosyltransferase family 39 protein [Bacteroidota bacterium]
MVKSSTRNPGKKKYKYPGVSEVVQRSRFNVLQESRWIVLALAIIVYGWNFWGTSIYMLDEAKNAGSAAEMIRRADYLVPTFNNEFHDKPALQYFFMIAGYKLFGVNAFGARIFSVLMGILSVMSIYLFSRKILNERTAFFASIIYIASLQMAVQFRLAVPDPYLLFCLTTGWFCFYLGYKEGGTKYLYAFYALIGLAFLAKGPIAFALPGLSILIFLVSQRDLSFKRLAKLKIIPGVLITLLIGLPWYVASGLATDWEWPKYFFFTHNIDRYVNTFEGHGGFPFDVVVIAIAALLPSSVVMPQAVVLAVKSRKDNQFFPFALSICAAVLGFFFFSKTLLPSYPSPCIPFLAVLLGFYIQQQSTSNTALKISAVVALIICLAIPVAAYIAIDQDILLSGLSNRWMLFLVAPVGAIIALYFVINDEVAKAFYTWTGSFMVLLILVFTWLLPQVDAQNPVVKSKDILNGELAYYKRINAAFVFEVGKPIPKLETPVEVNEFIKAHPNAKIISTRSDWEEIGEVNFKVIFRSKDLLESPESIIVTPLFGGNH